MWRVVTSELENFCFFKAKSTVGVPRNNFEKISERGVHGKVRSTMGRISDNLSKIVPGPRRIIMTSFSKFMMERKFRPRRSWNSSEISERLPRVWMGWFVISDVAGGGVIRPAVMSAKPTNGGLMVVGVSEDGDELSPVVMSDPLTNGV